MHYREKVAAKGETLSHLRTLLMEQRLENATLKCEVARLSRIVGDVASALDTYIISKLPLFQKQGESMRAPGEGEIRSDSYEACEDSRSILEIGEDIARSVREIEEAL